METPGVAIADTIILPGEVCINSYLGLMNRIKEEGPLVVPHAIKIQHTKPSLSGSSMLYSLLFHRPNKSLCFVTAVFKVVATRAMPLS